jgi:hypothetical protein
VDTKGFWYFLMYGSVALFAFSIWLGYYLFPDNTLCAWALFLGLVVIHLSEIPIVSLRIGKEKNIPLPAVIVKTFLFGFTWWLPLRRGIIGK